ncbi:pyocin knob domain-containing protein [Citrobacter freundii]|uniref:pyocin knob domain-containing protein n=1 Tax=Citrobacter freundii TaxID=546 RepID=UPI0020172A50|nr:pyocin knob domain-containing protein [Citrobacter freundii]
MALSLLAANNAQTVLAAGISSTATSLTVNTGTGTLFPSPVTGTSFFKLTIIDAATGTLTEIVHVTARNGDVFTIQRGQEGTVPRAWSANDIVANMMTAGTLSYILGNFQPLDPTLTALAALVGVANKLPYFNGDDTAALTDLTQVGRDIIGKTDIAAVLQYLGLSDAFLIKNKYLPASLNLNTLGGEGKYGIYAQPVTNNASVSSNYPTQEAGSLLVTPAANNGMQIYTTLSGNVWSRTSLDNTNTQWSAWVRPGFKTLDKNIDLNYLGGVDKYGFYGQSVSNDATPENNYPVKEAGTLLVSPAAYNGLQVYITLSGLIWSRYSLDSTNTNWSQWVRQALKSELDDGLALKFDSSSLSTTGKALVAKSTIADMRTYLELLSAAQRDVGTGANQIPDMNAFSGSIVSKGYQKLPGGLIIQWGINNASVGGTSGNGEDVSYAIPFPNGCLSLTATFDNGGPVIPSAAASIVDNVYFKLRCSEASGSYIFRWIALGF